MIDENKTFKSIGCKSINLKNTSRLKICRICDNCNKENWIRHDSFLSAKHPGLCQSCWQLGKIISDETRLKQSKSNRRINKDKLMCDEQKFKISKSHIGLHWTDETKIKLSCTKQGIDRKDFAGFLTDQKYCNLWTEKFRQQIRNLFHNKCYLCNKTTKRKLSVHHVNYDKNCLCQKTCEFVPLCGSCHNKTNHNRQYWEDLIMNYLYPNRYFMINI